MILYISVGIIMLVIGGSITLAILSHRPPALGLVAGHLTPCPSSPNCVSSEADPTDRLHYIAPIPNDDPQAWYKLVMAIQSSGGTVIFQQDKRYLHATFTSPLMRYVDDVEARVDSKSHTIHWRSASRVGHSDFGANRKRIEHLRHNIFSR